MIRPKRKSPRAQHDPAFRVMVVKTSLEKQLSVDRGYDLYGVGPYTWYKWKRGSVQSSSHFPESGPQPVRPGNLPTYVS